MKVIVVHLHFTMLKSMNTPTQPFLHVATGTSKMCIEHGKSLI
jgi:hypothetical protein